MKKGSGLGASRVRRSVVLFFVMVFVAMIWPVYPFFSAIEPMVLGLPLSLAYILGILLLTFTVLLAFYLWETRRGELE